MPSQAFTYTFQIEGAPCLAEGSVHPTAGDSATPSGAFPNSLYHPTRSQNGLRWEFDVLQRTPNPSKWMLVNKQMGTASKACAPDSCFMQILDMSRCGREPQRSAQQKSELTPRGSQIFPSLPVGPLQGGPLGDSAMPL